MLTTRVRKVGSIAIAVAVVVGLSGAADARSRDGGAEPDSPRGQGASAVAVNAELDVESRFVAVPPCRLLDTRSAGGKIAAGSVRAFDVFGTNLSAQGGSATGCAIPDYADSIAVNLTAVDPAGTGFLRGDAQNTFVSPNPDPGTSSALPNATLVNYSTALNATNGTPLPVCNETAVECSGSKEIRLGAFTKATHVVADVVGYFVEPVFAVVDGDGVADGAQALRRSNLVTGVNRVGTGLYEVSTARDVRGCAIDPSVGASDDSDVVTSAAFAVIEGMSDSLVEVVVYDASGASVSEDFSIVAHC